jgi:peroxiredoxin
MATAAVGECAPTVALTGLDEQVYRLEQTNGPVLIAFFKVDCETCRFTFPYLEKLCRAYPQPGWHLWGISQDSAADSQRFAEQYGVNFPILLDEGWAASRTCDPEGVPTLFFIAPDRRILRVAPAFQKAALNELSAAIAEHLGAESVVVAPADDPAPSFRPG